MASKQKLCLLKGDPWDSALNSCTSLREPGIPQWFMELENGYWEWGLGEETLQHIGNALVSNPNKLTDSAGWTWVESTLWSDSLSEVHMSPGKVVTNPSWVWGSCTAYARPWISSAETGMLIQFLCYSGIFCGLCKAYRLHETTFTSCLAMCQVRTCCLITSVSRPYRWVLILFPLTNERTRVHKNEAICSGLKKVKNQP